MAEPLLQVTVECYAGYRGEETPRVVMLGERRMEIADVLDRWLAPTHRYFKVLGKDGNTCIIRHDVRTGHWELTLYQRGLLE